MCEGGPSTIGQLVADDLLDELCVTIASTLVAGDGPRIAPRPPDRGLSLARILAADDHLFVRYLRPLSGRLRLRRYPPLSAACAVRLVSRVSSRSKSARSSKPL